MCVCHLHFIPAMRSNLLEAIVIGLSWYLSEKYTTSLIPCGIHQRYFDIYFGLHAWDTFTTKRQHSAHDDCFEWISVPGLTSTCLDDELGALVAWKECHVDSAGFHISAVLIHYGIKLCMAHWKGGGRRVLWHVMTVLRQIKWLKLGQERILRMLASTHSFVSNLRAPSMDIDEKLHFCGQLHCSENV